MSAGTDRPAGSDRHKAIESSEYGIEIFQWVRITPEGIQHMLTSSDEPQSPSDLMVSSDQSKPYCDSVPIRCERVYHVELQLEASTPAYCPSGCATSYVAFEGARVLATHGNGPDLHERLETFAAVWALCGHGKTPWQSGWIDLPRVSWPLYGRK